MSDKGKNSNTNSKKLEKIKSSVMSRSLSVAKMTLSTGTSLAGHTLSTLFKNDTEKSTLWQKFLQNQAKDLTNELGELKGSLMKAGQMLSMYGEHFLPPEANQVLKALQFQSPPLQWAAIEPILIAELGDKLNDLEIEVESIGSASLGQVHRARIKATDEQIVLKVQYPGVDKAIDSDLRAIKSLLGILKILPRNLNTDHLFQEVREMLIQETNYELEVEQTEKYRERLQSDSRYIVPRIYRHYCSKRIIASSFEKGLSPDDPLVHSLSQARKNRLALNFIDLYFKELFQWGVVQTDPHLGNYKVRLSPLGEDQLVLLDFGAVRIYEESFLKPYYQMIKSALVSDQASLEEAAKQLKFVHDEDETELKQLFEQFCLD
ncbi:MAG: AarF/ABC1/UbiB kinase family protein, partial [Proteobacteria bacterium]|nr:AarF/ABC1/UbiB kinase family protein [Pseudomonadota bacterium]